MKFKVGDIVRVVRKVESYDINGIGEGEKWCYRWSDDMSNFIGKEVEVKVCYLKLGYCVESGYCFPETALELVKEGLSTKKPHYEYILAWANGADIQVKDSNGNWVDVRVPLWHPNDVYRIKKNYKHPIIPWDQISPEYKWYARSANGKCHFYRDKVSPTSMWWQSFHAPVPADFLKGHIPGDCPWEESLVERPEGV